MGGEGKVTLLCGGPGEFREPSGGSGRDSEQNPRGGAHHSLSGADLCCRGLSGPEGAKWRGRGTGSGNAGHDERAGAESRGFTWERQQEGADCEFPKARQVSGCIRNSEERSPGTHRVVRCAGGGGAGKGRA